MDSICNKIGLNTVDSDSSSEDEESDVGKESEHMTKIAKNGLVNIYKYVRKYVVTDECYGDVHNCYLEETSKLSGIPKSTIRQVVSESTKIKDLPGQCRKVVQFFLSDQQKSKIQSIIHNMFEKGDVPCHLEKIFNYIRNDKTLPKFGLPVLKMILDSMKYTTVKKHSKIVIIECMDYVLERVEYLKKIKECREQNRRIFYLDEVQIHINHEDGSGPSKEKKSKLENISPKLKEAIYLGHIGNENGFLEGCEWISPVQNVNKKLSSKSFQKWFGDVLPKLQPKDVIVMDYTKHHCRKAGANQTTKVRKTSQPFFLKRPVNEIVLAVKEMANKYDIEVLILPHYHNDLNPLEDIWQDITEYIENHRGGSKEAKELIMEAINSVTDTVWMSNINKVKEKEEYLRWIDLIIDDAVDEYLQANNEPEVIVQTANTTKAIKTEPIYDSSSDGETEVGMNIKIEPDLDITIKDEPFPNQVNDGFDEMEEEYVSIELKKECEFDQNFDPLE